MVLDRLESVFYTPLLVHISIIIALIYQWRNSSSHLYNITFRYLTYLAFVVFLVSDIFLIVIPSTIITSKITEGGNVFYSVTELTIFIFYFQHLFKSRYFSIIRSFILLTTIALTILFVKILIVDSDYKMMADIICNFELITLTFCCLFYYYKILNDSESKDLKTLPSFWIVCGLFFYCIVSLPFFFISTYLSDNFPSLYLALFGVHYIFLSIFFFLLAKAYSCKQPQLN
jgi:hypothetical protein